MIKFLANESVDEKAKDYQAGIVTEAARIMDENKWSAKYPMLAAGLESSDPKEQYINAYTAMLMRNQAAFMDEAVRRYGESTVVSKLGDIAPRIMDVIRVEMPRRLAIAC